MNDGSRSGPACDRTTLVGLIVDPKPTEPVGANGEMAMIKTVLLCTLVVGASTITHGDPTSHADAFGYRDASRELSARDFAGFWRNTLPHAQFLKFLEIAAPDVDKVMIRAWLRCNPSSTQVGTLEQCRRWRSGVLRAEAVDRIVWDYPEPRVGRNVLTLTGDTLTVFTPGLGGYNVFERVLGEAVSCLGPPERSADGSLVCRAEGGRDFGKAGRRFESGDRVYVLLRFIHLPVGSHRIQTWIESRSGGRRRVSTNWAYDATFSNGQEKWPLWFPANADAPGQWTIHLTLDGEVSLGSVSYCVDCPLE